MEAAKGRASAIRAIIVISTILADDFLVLNDFQADFSCFISP